MVNNENKKIRIAVLGCGRISQSHFDSIQKHKEDIDLISICDTDDEVLSRSETNYGVKGYLKLKEMLENESLDLVAICTPSGLHAKQAELCAKYGVHVMTEKPMATSWQDGVKMVKTCDKFGVHLFVVKQNRKNPTLQLLKRAVEEDRFGKINLVHLNVFWTRPQSYYDQADWRGTWKLDGGAFMNQASHYVDLLEWLIGPVEKVQSMINTSLDIEVEDTGVMNLKWKNGALGSMSVTMLTYPKNLEGSITILGDKGSARIAGEAVNKIDYWNFSDSKDYDLDITNNNYKIDSVYGFGHIKYYENVINVLRENAKPEVDGREGLKSLEIIIAAYLSSKDGKIVSLPLGG
jgi:UDP-N-acetyl-2-amino-2-deoxyglucuronate dehydrogenase